jgi:catechol 2,3-dioxygenase-like lactoylglutathione lyase family enzyme
MALHRLTGITLGVPDPVASEAFFAAFGLRAAGRGRLATRDAGEQLILERAPVRDLRRIGVGAGDPDDVARIAKRLDAAGIVFATETGGALVAAEPVTGVRVEVSVAEPLVPTPAVPTPAPVNSTAGVARTDRPAAALLRTSAVQPSNLTHLAFGSPDQPATLAFFTDLIGFEISDELPGVVAFVRCGEVHHNLALQAAPCAYVHHVAFEVDDVDEVARGGTEMILAHPERHLWGLGRHAIGSNWFWYLREPCGTFVEYTADVDRITAQDRYTPKDWQGHEFLYAFGSPPPPEFLDPPDLAEILAAITGG